MFLIWREQERGKRCLPLTQVFHEVKLASWCALGMETGERN
jgi:hypothetical protein